MQWASQHAYACWTGGTSTKDPDFLEIDSTFAALLGLADGDSVRSGDAFYYYWF